MNNNKNIGVLCVILAGLFWGSAGLFVRKLNAAGFTTMQVVAARSAISFVILTVIALVRNPGAFRIRLRDVWMFFGTGIVSVVVFNWCYFTCMIKTTLSVACVLMYTSPAFATILAALIFRERITLRKVLALVVAFAGCVVATGIWTGASGLSVGGVLIGLCSGLFYALYSIFSRFALKRYSALTVNLYTFLFASVGALPLSKPSEIAGYLLQTPATWWYVLGVGLVAAVIPYLLFTYGLTRVDVSRANIIVTVEIAAVLFFSIAVFREGFFWYNLVGIALVIAAVVLLALPERARPAVSPADGQPSISDAKASPANAAHAAEAAAPSHDTHD